MLGHHPTLDDRDEAIIAERIAARDSRLGPQVGDYAIVDGEERRISYIWPDGDGVIQTSRGGSWYLGEYGASFSGSLEPGIDGGRFVETLETRPGSFWIFHHDYTMAHNGVHFEAPCRVWRVLDSITHAEWAAKPASEKLIRDDTCYVLRWIDGAGTCLVPVWVSK
jgi:hypothetical protein